jgi:putative Ca2+/H+ antiporter (TMEM165/GDT1 family)
MAGCALGLISLHAGDHATSQTWITDARRRCDRVSDQYVWVSAYIGLANLELAVRDRTGRAASAAAQLYTDAARTDLPEFLAWALVYRAELGDRSQIPLACTAAEGVANPVLQARIQAPTS